MEMKVTLINTVHNLTIHSNTDQKANLAGERYSCVKVPIRPTGFFMVLESA